MKKTTKQKNKPKVNKPEIRKVPLEKLRLDGGTQARVMMRTDLVGEYAEAMKAGAEFPPVIAYDDGENLWLSAGFHRIAGAKVAGQKTLWTEIRKGTQRDAILDSVGENSAHGLRRTYDDKRKAVNMLLADMEWRKWSDRSIAKACNVSPSFVGDLRKLTVAVDSDKRTGASKKADSQEKRTYKAKSGKEAKMAVGKIGKSPSRRIDSSTSQDAPDEPLAAKATDTAPAKPEAPAKPPEPLKDDLGTPLPPDDGVRKAFADAVIFDDLMERLSQIKAAVNKLDDGASYIRKAELLAYLTNARNELRDARPYAICPYCGGKGCKSDTGCRGVRFVTKSMYERAPEEKRKGAA